MSESSIQDINEKSIAEFSIVAEKLPGVVIVHDLRDWAVAWMSSSGLKLLGLSLEEVKALSHEEYFSKYFNKEETDDFVPKILGLLQQNNTEDICTHFHQVRFTVNGDFNWYMGGVRILTRDAQGKPSLVVTIVLPIDSMHHMAAKAERLLAENNFLRKNYHKFDQLTRREREILGMTALGKSASEISEALFISLHTVETHRKNIKKKLGTNSYYNLNQYARAFDLI
jgi:DNA-binding CsgD family transcriptional regulator